MTFTPGRSAEGFVSSQDVLRLGVMLTLAMHIIPSPTLCNDTVLVLRLEVATFLRE